MGPNFGVKLDKLRFEKKRFSDRIYTIIIMGVENTKNDEITYVGYDLIVGVASIIPILRIDMTYVNVQ